MLFGEHAVLHGHPAVVCAIDSWIEIELTPREDSLIKIISDRLGEYSCDVKQMIIEPPFQFVLAAITAFNIKQGITIKIHSQFSPQWGLGSSAAVTAAMTKILSDFTEQQLNANELFEKSLAIVQDIQKVGSGADLAASIFGGVLSYQTQPQKIESLTLDLPLSLVYSGYKTPTTEVIKFVNTREKKAPSYYQSLYQAMGECSKLAIDAIKKQNTGTLIMAMKNYQGLQTALGVCTEDLRALIMAIEEYPDVLAAKISGSGLGDCMVALGTLPEDAFSTTKTKQLSITLSTQGVSGYE